MEDPETGLKGKFGLFFLNDRMNIHGPTLGAFHEVILVRLTKVWQEADCLFGLTIGDEKIVDHISRRSEISPETGANLLQFHLSSNPLGRIFVPEYR